MCKKIENMEFQQVMNVGVTKELCNVVEEKGTN